MNKKNKLKKIVKIMEKYKISVANIEEYMAVRNKKFDLLCIVDGVPVRLPFDEGKELSPIGVFPFQSNIYLEFGEVEKTRNLIGEEFIPKITLWDSIFNLKIPLNKVLERLGQPILDGLYYANPRTSEKDVNWIVNFRNNQLILDTEYYDADDVAKARFVGELKDGKLIPLA